MGNDQRPHYLRRGRNLAAVEDHRGIDYGCSLPGQTALRGFPAALKEPQLPLALCHRLCSASQPTALRQSCPAELAKPRGRRPKALVPLPCAGRVNGHTLYCKAVRGKPPSGTGVLFSGVEQTLIACLPSTAPGLQEWGSNRRSPPFISPANMCCAPCAKATEH